MMPWLFLYSRNGVLTVENRTGSAGVWTDNGVCPASKVQGVAATKAPEVPVTTQTRNSRLFRL